jgi:hypothetical protein
MADPNAAYEASPTHEAAGDGSGPDAPPRYRSTRPVVKSAPVAAMTKSSKPSAFASPTPATP